MQKTIFAILTNQQARSPSAIETNLDEDFSVGAPWFFDKSQELTDKK